MHSFRTQTRILIAALSLVAMLVLAPGASASPASAAKACAGAGAEPNQASHRTLVKATVCLLNKQRRSRGMKALKLSKRLGLAARRHSVDMSSKRYFSHNSRSGASFIDRIRRSGYLKSARSWLVGENIAWGTGNLATPRSIVRAWMNSPGHRANILNRRFRQIGIGISFSAPVPDAGDSAGTYTTDFGTRR
jgi:uncharacterized protein YkwD